MAGIVYLVIVDDEERGPTIPRDAVVFCSCVLLVSVWLIVQGF
jgi:hypothetical protein